MRITKETIDQIYAAIDIVEVIGDFVALKKRGANYMARSPFVNEKTPSFSVSPSKQIFKCFSSGKGGDAVKFLMEAEKMTYVEALKYLANKYNIELKYDQTLTDEQQELQVEKDAMFIAMEFAKNYYKDILFNNETGKAVGYTYFIERGLDKETIETFELGFALDQWDHFLNTAKNAQYNVDILEKCGLIKTSESGKKFDFIRNRVVYPIQSAAGKIIAFAGRILTNEKGQPKYVNSPETELYNKSEVLYGLFQAKNEIRSENNCLLVEGYMDVISLYQAGIRNVVASSGTSLTPGQIKLISRFTENVTVLYDGDAAGIKAAIRGTDLLLDSGLKIKVLLFPDGDDPDSFVNKVGSTQFKEYLKANAKDFIHYKTEILLKDAGNDPIKKSEVIKDLVVSISKIKDGIQRAIYFKSCSQLLDIEEQVVISEYNKIILGQRNKDENKLNEGNTIDPSIAESEAPIQSIEALEFIDIDEYSEKEFVRILLEYGDFSPEEQPFLYQQIFESIQNIEFKNHVVARIFQMYQDELEKGQIPSIDYFLTNPDAEIENFLVEILSDKYELSENWVEKFSIWIPPKDSDKINLYTKTLMRLNFEKCRFVFKENQKELKSISPTEIEKEEELLNKQIFIKDLQKQFAQNIGLVVSG